MDLKIVIATHFAEVFDLVNNYNPIAVTLDVKLPGRQWMENSGPFQK